MLLERKAAFGQSGNVAIRSVVAAYNEGRFLSLQPLQHEEHAIVDIDREAVHIQQLQALAIAHKILQERSHVANVGAVSNVQRLQQGTIVHDVYHALIVDLATPHEQQSQVRVRQPLGRVNIGPADRQTGQHAQLSDVPERVVAQVVARHHTETTQIGALARDVNDGIVYIQLVELTGHHVLLPDMVLMPSSTMSRSVAEHASTMYVKPLSK